MTNLPRYITLPAASEKYGISQETLTDWLKRGIIEAITTDRGELVSQKAVENNLPKDKIIQLRYPDLIGVGITISNAEKRYKLSNSTIRVWIEKGWVSVVDSGYPLKIDEADVAYVASIHHKRRRSGIGFRGAPLLDETGREYQLKHAWLSEYRKGKREPVAA